MKRMKFNLVIGSIISALALSSCAKDFSLNSTKQICIDYLNAGPLSGLNTRHSGRKAELGGLRVVGRLSSPLHQHPLNTINHQVLLAQE